MSTTSAASMAASLPIAPIAMPMSARDSTGASLIPSPTNATFASACEDSRIFSICDTLSAGSSWLCTLSMPRLPAICSATGLASPVSITVCVTPDLRRSATASLEVGFTTSPKTMCPEYLPPTATWTIVPAVLQWHGVRFISAISLSFPTATTTPSIVADIPLPLISLTLLMRLRSIALPYACCNDLAIGCEDDDSTMAAYSNNCAFSASTSISMSPWS